MTQGTDQTSLHGAFAGADFYQQMALQTAVYPQKWQVVYPALKLAGEAGEVAEKIGKALRDKEGVIDLELNQKLKLELGDVLWYVAVLARDLGWSMQDIMVANIMKLAGRQERGTLHGAGDNR